jgi:hypothetical protein
MTAGNAVLILVTALLSHVSGFCMARWDQWKLQRKMRPIPLPGMSQEEHETQVFIDKLHDTTQDDLALDQYEPKTERQRRAKVLASIEPAQITSAAHLRYDAMRRIQDALIERQLSK